MSNNTSWQDDAAASTAKVLKQRTENAAAAGAEAVCIVAPEKKGGLQALAKVYVQLRDNKKMRVKVVCTSPLQAQKFFENTLPALGLVTDIFATLDNETMALGDADVILVDDATGVNATTVQKITEVVLRRKNALVVVITDEEPETLKTFGALKKRFVRTTPFIS